MIKELFWTPKPILSLINEFDYGGTGDRNKVLISPEGLPTVNETDAIWSFADWNGAGVVNEFRSSAFNNVIKFSVRFKSKNAYGKFAKYLLLVERFENNTWSLEIRDLVCYCTDNLDRKKWYYWDREYSLPQSISFITYRMKRNTTVKFKITGYVAVARNQNWSNPDFKDFTAILPPPKLSIAKKFLVYERKAIDQYEQAFRK